ncbi:hypothetical protein BU15DRAFT_51573 [Melanogaster broomeanus]|nr:hypothetical protein BU15DRAFT_51573 [Melanogaster broomeanus]
MKVRQAWLLPLHSISLFDDVLYRVTSCYTGSAYPFVTYHAMRGAGRDDILPLSQPITTEFGHVPKEVQCPFLKEPALWRLSHLSLRTIGWLPPYNLYNLYANLETE